MIRNGESHTSGRGESHADRRGESHSVHVAKAMFAGVAKATAIEVAKAIRSTMAKAMLGHLNLYCSCLCAAGGGSRHTVLIFPFVIIFGSRSQRPQPRTCVCFRA